MARHRGAVLAVAIGMVAAASLAGCSIGSGATLGGAMARQARDAGSAAGEWTPPEAAPPVPGSTDWATLPTCSEELTGTSSPWARTAGYPEEELDAALIVAECGYAGSGLTAAESYVGVVSVVDDHAIYSYGGQLTYAGWHLQYDDFLPDLGGVNGDYAGSREYVTDAGELLRVEAYDNGTVPTTFTTYFEYSRPADGQPS